MVETGGFFLDGFCGGLADSNGGGVGSMGFGGCGFNRFWW